MRRTNRHPRPGDGVLAGRCRCWPPAGRPRSRSSPPRARVRRRCTRPKWLLAPRRAPRGCRPARKSSRWPASPATRKPARACPARSRRSRSRTTCCANPDRAVGVVVRGLQGEVTVNGQKFNSVMPAMTQLTDQQVADVLTYVLNTWGNKGGSVAVERVAAERAARREGRHQGRLADAAPDHGRRTAVPGRGLAGRRARTPRSASRPARRT